MSEATDRMDDVCALPLVQRIVDNFDRGLLLTDLEQRILYVNPRFSEITGYAFDEAVGQSPRPSQFRPPGHRVLPRHVGCLA